MFTVAAFWASSGLFFPAGKAYYRKWRSDSLFKDSFFSFAAELCCETSFYHPSPRPIHLPSLSAPAPRLWVLWKAPFIQIYVQFSHVLMTVKSRYHLGTLTFNLSDASTTNSQQKCHNDASALISIHNGDIIMISSLRIYVLWTAPHHLRAVSTP